jgi:hypothetical protein
MNRVTVLLVGLVSILGVAACSSDNSLSVTSSKQQSAGTAADSGSASSDSSGSDADTSASALSVPDIGSIPGISADCTAYLTAIASAFTPSADGAAGVADSFDALEKQAPADLKDDVRVLRDGFAKLQKLYAKYNNDYSKIVTDPEAATLFSDKSFTDASANVSAWLESECPAG